MSGCHQRSPRRAEHGVGVMVLVPSLFSPRQFSCSGPSTDVPDWSLPHRIVIEMRQAVNKTLHVQRMRPDESRRSRKSLAIRKPSRRREIVRAAGLDIRPKLVGPVAQLGTPLLLIGRGRLIKPAQGGLHQKPPCFGLEMFVGWYRRGRDDDDDTRTPTRGTPPLLLKMAQKNQEVLDRVC